MSYTYLLDAGEESSAECFSDIPPSVLSRLRSIAGIRCSSVSAMEYLTDSQSGTTCEHSTENHGEELLTSCAAASPAKTLASPEKVKEFQDCAAGFGNKWLESFAKWNPESRSWKIRQLSLFEDLESCLVIWPKWGMMQNGECLELRMPSGLKELRHFITTDLESSSRLPTPTVCGNYNRKGASATSGDGLATALKKLPTPTKSDASMRKAPKNFKVTKTGIIRHLNEFGEESQIRLCQQIADGGPMNPEWVEWFMGWPIGQTGLKPLAMVKFQQWLNSHGEP